MPFRSIVRPLPLFHQDFCLRNNAKDLPIPIGCNRLVRIRVDNPRNGDVKGISAQEVHSLFPGFNLDVRRVTLAPPLARRAAPASPMIFRLLAAAPWLRTHLLIWLNRPA